MHRVLLVFIALLLFSFFYFDLHQYLSLDALRNYQTVIEYWTTSHHILSVFLFILIFTGLIACAIPCATFMTLVGGFLFGPLAILYSTFGITVGGMTLFLIVRSAIGEKLRTRKGGWVKRFEHGFRKNAFYYLMALRLVPVFPCWISNVGAGLFNVRLLTFLTATILGTLPATIIYVYAGLGLDKILVENAPVEEILFTPSVILPLIGLAILSLLPVVYNLSRSSQKD